MVVLPAPTPRTVPLPSTIAAAVLLLLHVPPVDPLLVSASVEPTHTEDDAPEIVPAFGVGLTVTT